MLSTKPSGKRIGAEQDWTKRLRKLHQENLRSCLEILPHSRAGMIPCGHLFSLLLYKLGGRDAKGRYQILVAAGEDEILNTFSAYLSLEGYTVSIGFEPEKVVYYAKERNNAEARS